jgi:hypothetical protein
MNAECEFRPMGASKTVSSVVPRVARLTLAVFIALVALACLCDRLSMARRRIQVSHTAAVGQPTDGSECTLCETTQDVPANCQRSTLSATKQVNPPNPDTGSVVTITFTITGLGLKRLDVVLVQDVSGSMDERDTPGGRGRLEVAQEAAITFVGQLSDTDRAGVVAYNDTAWLVQPATSDKSTVISAINSLPSPDRRTNIGAGIQAGYTELITDNWRPKAVRAMILLSDGGANEPSNDPGDYARDWARDASECGIMVYTIGLGDGVSETLMQNIADLSGGEYYFSPDGENLATIYQEIALALRNLVITDVLPPGVDVDCSLFPPGMCSQEDGLTTTIVISTSNKDLITNPLTLSFTATVNLDPPNQYRINVEGSSMCYDGPAITPCQDFENPTATVGGRKITGVVFEDMNCDGHFGDDEDVIPDVVVTTSNGLISRTDLSGVYVFRTPETPTLSIAVSVPAVYQACTPVVTRIRPVSGTYHWDFGLHPLVGGIMLSSLRVEPYPKHHGDSVTLHYSVTNQDQEYSAVGGTVLIEDSIARSFDGGSFGEVPHDETIPGHSVPFSVPRDIMITLTARATQSGIPVTAQAITGPLCPVDTYEPDDNPGGAYPIYPGVPQLHDFYTDGDVDWVGLRLHPPDEALYVFSALPLGPKGVHICIDLYQGGTTLTRCNTGNYKSPVAIMKALSCTGADVCDYFLRVRSDSSTDRCWTDYELSVREIHNPQYVYLPLVLRDS